MSTAGHPNFGDEFIAASWLRFLAERQPDTDVVLDCPDPGMAAFLFEGLHPRVKFTNLLWRVSWMTMPGTPVRTDVADDALHGMTSPAGDTTFTSRPVPSQPGPLLAVSAKRA